MKKFGKYLLLGIVIMVFMTNMFSGCNNKGNDSGTTSKKISTITYTKPVKIDDMYKWYRAIKQNDKNLPVENGLVICPFYTLKVDGQKVPVYTTRCLNGMHSFAWINVKGAPETFSLSVELETEKNYTGVVVLPEKSGVNATLNDKTVTATISAYGDYSFAFASGKNPDVDNEPLTLMVAPEQKLEIPDGYTIKNISPDKYGYDDLVFKQDNTIYVFESGEYELRRIYTSNSNNVIFYFQPGCYFSVYETPDRGLDEYNIGGPVFGIQSCTNVKILGRALFDFSAVRGLYVDENGKDVDMTQYVFNFYCNKNMYISGITTINSNHWTFRVCGCEDVLAEWNMMFGYRNYSDGFIYSDCKNATARNMFCRTGDDGIEVKALGWHGSCWRDKNVDVSLQPATNILFEKCTVWNDAAAAFGMIYENYTPVDGVIFRDCSVGFTTCTWSPNNSALNVRLTYPGTAHWKNILFENIEIYTCESNAFTLEWHMKGGTVENVLVKNVTVKRSPSWPAIRVCMDMDNTPSDSSLSSLCKNFVFENFTFRGKVLTEADKNDIACCSFSRKTTAYKNLFTIK